MLECLKVSLKVGVGNTTTSHSAQESTEKKKKKNGGVGPAHLHSPLRFQTGLSSDGHNLIRKIDFRDNWLSEVNVELEDANLLYNLIIYLIYHSNLLINFIK